MSVESIDDGVYELDAREIDGEPFSKIMSALENLHKDGTLVLINSFEPKPLYNVLEQWGFSHETTKQAADEWRVSITHI